MTTNKQLTKANGGKTEPPSSAIVPAGGAALEGRPSEETVQQALARAEKQIQYRKGLLKLIAANVNASDVLVYGNLGDEHIHFTKAACKQILSWAGARLEMDNTILEKKYDGPDGPYLDFEVHGTVLTGDGRYIRTMGNRSTYDDFFAKRTRYLCPTCQAHTHYGNGKQTCPKCGPVTARKETYYLPLTEVDVPAVKQAAITNLWNHALEDLGLKPSFDELKAAGMDVSKLKRVEFGGAGSTGKPQGTPTPKPTSTPPPAHKAGTPAPPRSQAATGTIRPPKAQIPTVVTSVKAAVTQTGKNKGAPYLIVEQGGQKLYCFKNSEIEDGRGGKVKMFTLLGAAEGKLCLFKLDHGEKDGRSFAQIAAILRIGDLEWDEDGSSVLRRGPSNDYQAADEDVPF